MGWDGLGWGDPCAIGLRPVCDRFAIGLRSALPSHLVPAATGVRPLATDRLPSLVLLLGARLVTTSPVAEIIEQNELHVTFKTESGSIYRLDIEPETQA